MSLLFQNLHLKSINMSEEYSNQLWKEAMQDLGCLIKEEMDRSTSKRQLPTKELYNFYAELYIRYIVVLTRLDKCYTSFVQPQKRLDIRSLLPLLSTRVLELRYKLVKWNKSWLLSTDSTSSANTENNNNKIRWEYIDLTAQLTKLRLNTKDIAIPYMSFLTEEDCENRLRRDNLVKDCMMLKHGVECFYFDDVDKNKSLKCTKDEVDEMYATETVEDREESFDMAAVETMSPDCTNATSHNQTVLAAITIQKYIRGHMARANYAEHSCMEMECIGMMYDGAMAGNVLKLWNDQENRRNEKRLQRETEYHMALTKMRDVVRKEEGYAMAESLRTDRLKWITDYIVENQTVPESLDLFHEERNVKIANDANDKTDSGAVNVEKKGSNKERRNQRDQDVHNTPVAPFECPFLLLDEMQGFVSKFKTCWEANMNDPNSKHEKFSIDIAKTYTIRDEIFQEAKASVDEMVNANLSKIRVSNLEKLMRKAASLKKEKGKKCKKKKGKPLPGEAFHELKDMELSTMLNILVEHKLVNSCSSSLTLCDDPGRLPCDANEQLTSFLHQPINPSLTELRDAIMSYCVVPLCSETVRSHIDDDEIIRSILFYGPEGCGKASMAEAAASMARALFINISPRLLSNKFDDPAEATKLVHMIFTVAKNPSYAPVVIYLDECERIFAKKKCQSPEFTQFLKDLMIYKNQGLTKQDRVIIIGCTSNQELADFNTLQWKGNTGKPAKQGFFERILYFPLPNYFQRCNIWRQYMEDREEHTFHQTSALSSLNISLLANESENCSARDIKACIDRILTSSRMERINNYPLCHDEFRQILQEMRTDEKAIAQHEEFARKAAGFIDNIVRNQKTEKSGRNPKKVK